MKFEIESKEEIIDGEEIITWQLNKNDGVVIININKLFDDTNSECDWIDDRHQYLDVMYSDWAGNELHAIVNNTGDIVRDAIRSIEEYIDKYGLFIVMMSGFAMELEAVEYDLSDDDWKMAVVDRFGDFVIGPIYDKISYDHEERNFYIRLYPGNEIRYTMTGEKII